MNKKILILLLLVYTHATAQTIKITDALTGSAIANALISDAANQKQILSDDAGNADISSLLSENEISLSAVGYKILIVTKQDFTQPGYVAKLSSSVLAVPEIIISASRFSENKKEVAEQTEVISSSQMQFMNQPTTAEVLQNTGNVTVQKSQQGGGSPVLRGFEASKIQLVVDGVRMNNAIYRAGHLQNVITLDNAILDKAEVIYGPGSVMYGSDALGGVIHFYTKDPVLAQTIPVLVNANAMTRYATANQEKTAHADINVGLKKIAFLTSFTFSDFDDLRQGALRNPFYGDWGKCKSYAKRVDGVDSVFINDNENIQKYSGYSQLDLMEKVLFKQNDRILHKLNVQYSTSSDIPRYDRLTQESGGTLRFAEWYYGPQERLLMSYELDINNAKTFFDDAKIILAEQFIEESRHDRRLNRVALNHRTENVTASSINADLKKKTSIGEFNYGIEAVYNKVKSEAEVEDIETGEKEPLDTRYPGGGSTMSWYAAYLKHSVKPVSWFKLTEGLRFSYVTLESKFNDTTFFPLPFTRAEQKNSALNGNIGFVLMPGKEWYLNVIGSTGFRAPNVDDMAKVFESTQGRVVVPNEDLKPEYTYNIDIGISKTILKTVKVSTTGFYTLYRDAIVTKPATFNGADSIIYNGEMSQVVSSQNEQNAYLYGLSSAIEINLSSKAKLSSSLNYTYARIATDSADYPLDHIPPVYGKTSLSYESKKFTGEFFVLYNGWKRLRNYNLAGEDNITYATENGNPAWYTLNVRAGYSVCKNLTVQAALENILDYNYRVFASGIGGAGRNFIITLRGNF